MAQSDDAPIARAEFRAVAPDGGEAHVVIEIGRPHPTDTGDWACPAAVHGLGGPLHEIYGESSLQALALAMALVWTLVEAFVARGGRLFGVDEPDEWSLDELRAVFARTR